MTDSNIQPLDPHVRLNGSVDDAMLTSFIEQITACRKSVPASQPLVFEMTTTGGGAETARRIASDICLLRDYENRKLLFIGKSAVYSAGITIMAAFKPQERYLTKNTELLIHERRVERTLQLSGALRSNVTMLEDTLAELHSGSRLEQEGFRQLVEGTKVSLDQLMAKVMKADWYVQAREARELGLVRDIL